MPLNKRILEEYIDACELIKETEADIRKLEKQQKTIQQDSVQGSNPEFPYQRTHIHIEGIKASSVIDNRIVREKLLLEERKANAERIKVEVQEFMNQTSTRMQRIIRMKYFEGLPWEEVAMHMGKRATGDSVRMELERFLQNK